MKLQDFYTPEIPDRMYFKIGEVSEITGIESYVLRYWETEFKELTPEKSKSKQRMYEKKDIENILLIKKLLWQDRFSIEEARKKLKDLKKDNVQRKQKIEKSPENQQLKKVKYELKELLRFLRAN